MIVPLLPYRVHLNKANASFNKPPRHQALTPEGVGFFLANAVFIKRGGKFMPSLVAEIGECLETHMKSIGLIEAPELPEHQRRILEQKRAEYESRQSKGKGKDEGGQGGFPEGAQLCGKCMTQAMILMDGCMTCLNCGDSKCG